MFVEFNPNPMARHVGDCSVRAISKALDTDWETAYALIAAAGYSMADMPSSNSVWGAVLRQHGFYRAAIPNACPDCYTIEEFTKDYPEGTYVVMTGNHVVAVQDGDYYDTWDSGNEVPLYYYYKEEDHVQ